MASLGVVHEAAGGYDGQGQQRCILCGCVLADNGPNIARPMGVQTRRASWWAAGPVTEIDGGSQWVAGAVEGAVPCVQLHAG